MTTDDRGIYRLSNLEPNRYVVSVLSVQSTVLASTPEGAQRGALGELLTGGIGSGEKPIVRTPGLDVDERHRLVLTNFATPPAPQSDSPQAYAQTFYPGVTSLARCLVRRDCLRHRRAYWCRLPIAAGDRGASLRDSLDGVVAPVPAMLLRMLPAGSERLGFGSEAATTTVAPDGSFSFLNVPVGEYTILAQASVMDFTTSSAHVRLGDAPGFPGGGISVGGLNGVPGLSYLSRQGQNLPAWGRTSIAVGYAPDPTIWSSGCCRRSRSAAASSYRNGNTPPAITEFMIRAQPANGDPSLGQRDAFTSRSDPSRAFTLAGLGGGTFVISTDFARFALVSVMADGCDVTDTGIDASLGRDFDNVIVTITDRVAEINGVVRDSRGPVNAAVIAFPVEPARWINYGWSPMRLRTAPSGSSGTFAVSGLPAGEYFPIALNAAQAKSRFDPKFLAAAAAQATRISLMWGDKRAQDLVLTEVKVK